MYHRLAMRLSHIMQTDVTRTALSLQQFGLWPRAQSMFFAALTAVHGVATIEPRLGFPLPQPGSVLADHFPSSQI